MSRPADGASVEIARADDKSPLLFGIHTLKLTAVSQSKPLAYDYEVTYPTLSRPARFARMDISALDGALKTDAELSRMGLTPGDPVM